MLGYASIFETLFPRTLGVFEDISTNVAQSDILDLDVYEDLDHLLVSLRIEMRRDIKLLNGYCQIFGSIVRFLIEGRIPQASVIE
jgi:hypothetical protein